MPENLKIITYNVNGVRSALKKGLADWLAEERPHIFCMQEVKASEDQVDMDVFHQLGYRHVCWFSAQKKGYSGAAILSKIAPECAATGCGLPEYDHEGRVASMTFKGFTVMNVYFPSGSSGDVRQQVKMRWLDDFYDYLLSYYKQNPDLVICGDFNICHQPVDIHNPVANKNSSGFLPEEREWLDKFLDLGFIDAFRFFNEGPDHYTWWSYYANARTKNKGWRIDYLMASASMKNKLKSSVILKEAMHSDHCPVSLEIAEPFEIDDAPVMQKPAKGRQLSIFDA